MFDALTDVLRRYPEVAFFLVLGVGFLLGKLRLKGIAVGAVTGTMLAGVMVGQADVHVSADVKQCFFLLFLFSIGFRTGPQFFRGLKRDGLQQAVLSIIVATTALAAACSVSLLFGYDPGTAGGVLAGAMTASPTIGTTSDAIARLGLPPADTATLQNQIPVAFAVTYLVGVVGAATFLAQIAPRIMRIDLEEECQRYERQLQRRDDDPAGRAQVEYRAYTVQPGSPLIGRRPRELEGLAADARLFVERIRRGGRIIEAGAENLPLAAGETLAITGRRERLLDRVDEQRLGVLEVDDKELLDIPADVLDVVVTRREIDGRTLADLAREEFTRSVYLRRLSRSGVLVPLFPGTEVHRGDVLTLVGPAARVAEVVDRVGVPDRVTDVTDMILVAFSIVAGALIGIPALVVGRIEIGLSLSVGVLLGGLVCGWLRSMWPQFFGRVPAATLWVFESIGLAGFVAVVGLDAGPEFVRGLRMTGATLLVAGLVTVLVPHLVGILVGRWVFRMHPGVLLGVCAGAGTSTPALAAITEAAKSPVPTLGYGVAYSVGNVLLALWGSVIVALL